MVTKENNSNFERKPFSSLSDLKSEEMKSLEETESYLREINKRRNFFNIFLKKDSSGHDVLDIKSFSLVIGSIFFVIFFFVVSLSFAFKTPKNESKDKEEKKSSYILNEIAARNNTSASDESFFSNNYKSNIKDNSTNNENINIPSNKVINNFKKDNDNYNRIKKDLDNVSAQRYKYTQYVSVPVFAKEVKRDIISSNEVKEDFKPYPGQKIRCQLEFTKNTAVSTPVIAFPVDNKLLPKDSRFFGTISGEFDGYIVIMFSKLFIPPDQIIDITAIATDDDSTSLKGDYVGELELDKTINQGIKNSAFQILPDSSDFLGSLLSGAGQSFLGTLNTDINSKNVYELIKGTTLTIVFLPK